MSKYRVVGTRERDGSDAEVVLAADGPTEALDAARGMGICGESVERVEDAAGQVADPSTRPRGHRRWFLWAFLAPDGVRRDLRVPAGRLVGRWHPARGCRGDVGARVEASRGRRARRADRASARGGGEARGRGHARRPY